MAQETAPGDFTPLKRSWTYGSRLLASQAFWVTIAVVLISLVMTAISDAFPTEKNFFNISRNFSFIAIIALGQAAVIITGGIDLSVGSIMGITGIVVGLLMDHGWSFWVSSLAAILAGLVCGAFNGALIAYLRLSPFVVTLGMLSIARSMALVVSNNKMFYQFGPDQKILLWIGGAHTAGIPNSVIILAVLALLMGFLFRFTAWGRHVFAIGGNEQAARLTGVPVDWIKLSVYLLSGLMTAIAAILTVGWLGSVTNSLGTGYELRVIASTVLGGANLAGGEGGAYGAVVGAALIELIRNSLLLAGVDPYWNGTFVGVFIILAVLLERVRGRR